MAPIRLQKLSEILKVGHLLLGLKYSCAFSKLLTSKIGFAISFARTVC